MSGEVRPIVGFGSRRVAGRKKRHRENELTEGNEVHDSWVTQVQAQGPVARKQHGASKTGKDVASRQPTCATANPELAVKLGSRLNVGERRSPR